MSPQFPLLAGVLLALAGVAAYVALVVWTRRPGHADRWPLLAGATGTGLILGGLNVLSATVGWWDSATYALPLPVLAGLYVMWPTLLFAAFLAGYRWLATHMRRPRLVFGAIMLAVFAPFVFFIDTWGLATGRLSFGGGYAIWTDVLLGQALVWMPVLLYEAVRRWGHAHDAA